MPDNTRLHLGAGGDLIRTEDIGGAYKVAVSKIYLGAHGIDGGPVTDDNPMPVSVAGIVSVTGSVSLAETVAVLGNVNVDNTVDVQGAVNALPTTGVVFNGTVPLTIKRATISAASAGSNVVVAGVPGKVIRVLGYVAVASNMVDVQFRSGGVTPLTGSMPIAANSGVGAAVSPLGHFDTGVGADLTVQLSAAVLLAGHITYIEV